ncbi:GNAT family N-acetyltransferase [Methylobacterium sp. 77]|uniref:GNAT family N-acetyltransferase n=1 Tax=Methylobacterium sp. 77 TaxID=1101192 RepID=UPI00036C2C18|nr:GNAT family N-acetyltransferase [Methylobacterium sp. 77]
MAEDRHREPGIASDSGNWPQFHRNRSRSGDVLAHLTACDAAFTPPLGQRVPLADYAAKLVARAERFEAWSGSALVGLVAVYCDDPERNCAFVTSVSVNPDLTRAGLGRRLLEQAISHVRSLGFHRVTLSVDRKATALRLYGRLGFTTDAEAEETLQLSLYLVPQLEKRN